MTADLETDFHMHVHIYSYVVSSCQTSKILFLFIICGYHFFNEYINQKW